MAVTRLPCPNCQTSLRVDKILDASKAVACPRCRHLFWVSDVEQHTEVNLGPVAAAEPQRVEYEPEEYASRPRRRGKRRSTKGQENIVKSVLIGLGIAAALLVVLTLGFAVLGELAETARTVRQARGPIPAAEPPDRVVPAGGPLQHFQPEPSRPVRPREDPEERQPAPEPARPRRTESVQPASSGSAIYRQLLPSTVYVVTKAGRAGTGFLIDEQRGILVTNHHVIADAEEIIVAFPLMQDGRPIVDEEYYIQLAREGRHWLLAEVLADSPDQDLALLRVDRLPRGAKGLRIAPNEVSPGEQVHSIGNPGASKSLWVYTSGTVRTQPSRTRFPIRSTIVDIRSFETQSPINSGDSGGPVVNDRGELVGVVFATTNEANSISAIISSQELINLLRFNGLGN